jgi:hypothetical protein
MRFLRTVAFAAIVAGAGLWAGGASAATYYLEPYGPNNTVDGGFSFTDYDSFSVTVVFGGEGYDLKTLYGGTSVFFFTTPCSSPGPLCTSIGGGDILDLFDWTVTGERTYWDAPQPQVTWTPIDHGFTLNYYAMDLCHPITAGAFCHQVDRLRSFSIFGTAGSDQVIPYEVTFGEAAPRAVPEPATWAMMILGFGLVGGALRRRKLEIT